jgi:hypothetical protein
MKNNDIILFASLLAMSAGLLYRKYVKGNKAKNNLPKGMPGKSLFSSQPADEEYEPYSKKDTKG